MKRKEDKGAANTSLILRDMAVRLKVRLFRAGDLVRESGEKPELDGGAVSSGASRTASQKTSFDEAAKKIRQREEEARRLAAAAVAHPDANRVKEEENRKILELRARARDLQAQIGWWENQRGQGTHDNTTIDGMIVDLKNRLNGIPAQYWT